MKSNVLKEHIVLLTRPMDLFAHLVQTKFTLILLVLILVQKDSIKTKIFIKSQSVENVKKAAKFALELMLVLHAI